MFNQLYNNLPIAPNKEQAENEKRWRDEMERVPLEHIPTHRCPYCGGLMTTPKFWNSIAPAPATCIKCGYQYTPSNTSIQFQS